MKNLASIFTLGLLVAFFSCNDDSIDSMITTPVPSNESVSGTAFFDRDGDGVGELPMSGSRVFLGDSLAISSANDSIIFSTGIMTEVDEFGDYDFVGVRPAENQAIRILPIGPYQSLVGVDNIEDGDLNETLDNEIIQISIEEDESDDGNDFVAYWPIPAIIISGYVLEDVDGDLIGDKPVVGHRLLLTRREANGEPIGMGGFIGITDENGFFQYSSIQNGEYVINHVGTEEYDYRCVSNMDQSQEAGEPDADVECYLIPVNISDDVKEDHDNIFVIDKTSNVSISGYVLEDTDEDLNGDKPSIDHIMVLFERDDDGLGVNTVQSTRSDINGYYEFSNIPNGEYVIQHTGTPTYPHSCVSNMDQSQEVGEPDANVNCSFIPVNLNQTVSEDHDNVFVIKKSEVNSVSGYVLEDIDGDLIGDLPSKNHHITLQRRDASGQPTNIGGRIRISDENGFFEFTNILNGEYVLERIGVQGYMHICVSSMDQSQEVGEPDAIFDCLLPVNLDETVTEDKDNVFVVEKAGNLSISGYVLEDVDADLVGDSPSSGHLIKLYERNNNGEPVGDAIASIRSGINGYYEFRNISNGEYVLNHIGTSSYPFTCVANMDQSQETGEPDADVDCSFIPVNLNDMVPEDNDNVFVIERT